MRKPMRILAASDLHSDHHAAQALADKAEAYDIDVVLLCGDLTDFDTDSRGIIGPFVKKGKKVLFVPGNHDSSFTAEFLAKKYGVHNIDGYAVVINDVGFFGCGGANIGPHFRSEEETEAYLEQSARYLGNVEKKVMVTHVHPSGGIVEKESFPGSKAVERAIKKFSPNVHVSGHIHEKEGTTETSGKTKLLLTGKSGIIFEV